MKTFATTLDTERQQRERARKQVKKLDPRKICRQRYQKIETNCFCRKRKKQHHSTIHITPLFKGKTEVKMKPIIYAQVVNPTVLSADGGCRICTVESLNAVQKRGVRKRVNKIKHRPMIAVIIKYKRKRKKERKSSHLAIERNWPRSSADHNDHSAYSLLNALALGRPRDGDQNIHVRHEILCNAELQLSTIIDNDIDTLGIRVASECLTTRFPHRLRVLNRASAPRRNRG